MRIGDLAQRSGLTTATIRFYERQGLLPPPSRADNGYREYSVTDLERAVTFAGFRDLGIEPPEAARLADQCATGRCDVTFAELTPILAGHRAAIATRVAEMLALDARLAALQHTIVTTGQSDPSTGPNGKEVSMHCCDGGCCGGGCC